jgi:hypothetical protein
MCKLNIMSNRIKTISHDRFHYFGHCQALGQLLNLDLALCHGLGHVLHQSLVHHLNISLALCHGLGHGRGHGHGLGHGLGICLRRGAESEIVRVWGGESDRVRVWGVYFMVYFNI